tara:strand:- start:10917 stop:12134 length:1218 start_codon:yes stop_codon:yes gene_type:complete
MVTSSVGTISLLRMMHTLYLGVLANRVKGDNYVTYACNIYVIYHQLIDQMMNETLSLAFGLNASEKYETNASYRSECAQCNAAYICGLPLSKGTSKISKYCDAVGINLDEEIISKANNFLELRDYIYHTEISRHSFGYYPAAVSDILNDHGLSRIVSGQSINPNIRLGHHDFLVYVSRFIEYDLIPYLSSNIKNPFRDDSSACSFSLFRDYDLSAVSHVVQSEERGILGHGMTSNNGIFQNRRFPLSQNLIRVPSFDEEIKSELKMKHDMKLASYVRESIPDYSVSFIREHNFGNSFRMSSLDFCDNLLRLDKARTFFYSNPVNVSFRNMIMAIDEFYNSVLLFTFPVKDADLDFVTVKAGDDRYGPRTQSCIDRQNDLNSLARSLVVAIENYEANSSYLLEYNI